MIITRKVARWALLLKREALGRTYGAQDTRRGEGTRRGGYAAMLARPGCRPVDNNSQGETDRAVAAEPQGRRTSCVPLALSFPLPFYRCNPRAGTAAPLLLLTPGRPELEDSQEDEWPLASPVHPDPVRFAFTFAAITGQEPVRGNSRDRELEVDETDAEGEEDEDDHEEEEEEKEEAEAEAKEEEEGESQTQEAEEEEKVREEAKCTRGRGTSRESSVNSKKVSVKQDDPEDAAAPAGGMDCRQINRRNVRLRSCA